jgi:hypothetical protein
MNSKQLGYCGSTRWMLHRIKTLALLTLTEKHRYCFDYWERVDYESAAPQFNRPSYTVIITSLPSAKVVT